MKYTAGNVCTSHPSNIWIIIIIKHMALKQSAAQHVCYVSKTVLKIPSAPETFSHKSIMGFFILWSFSFSCISWTHLRVNELRLRLCRCSRFTWSLSSLPFKEIITSEFTALCHCNNSHTFLFVLALCSFFDISCWFLIFLIYLYRYCCVFCLRLNLFR